MQIKLSVFNQDKVALAILKTQTSVTAEHNMPDIVEITAFVEERIKPVKVANVTLVTLPSGEHELTLVDAYDVKFVAKLDADAFKKLDDACVSIAYQIQAELEQEALREASEAVADASATADSEAAEEEEEEDDDADEAVDSDDEPNEPVDDELDSDKPTVAEPTPEEIAEELAIEVAIEEAELEAVEKALNEGLASLVKPDENAPQPEL